MGARRRSARTGLTAVVATVLALGVGSAVAPIASAQDCTGRVSTALTTDELPGGEWSVSDGCLTPDAFYEYHDGPIRAQAALTTVTYDDGHVGRVAVGMLTLGDGVGLSIVGVEDSATGLVKWSAVLGDYVRTGDTASVTGAGVTLFPTEPAALDVSVSGTGTDILEAIAADEAARSTTTTAVPEETTIVPPSTLPTETTVAPTSVPSPETSVVESPTTEPPTTEAPTTSVP
jgi:hypothetical protein